MDLEAYKLQFLAFRDELQSFVYRIVAHREEAEDLTQETFIKVFERLSTFRQESSFKTWAFTIATNLARDSVRARKKWGEDWMDLVRQAHVEDEGLRKRKFAVVKNSTHGSYVMQEHVNYCFSCLSKTLLLEQQICLLLKEIYGFKVTEIMAITTLSEGKVKHHLADSRRHLTRIFQRKCALINKEGTCSQCTGLNHIFNPEQEAHREANKMKLVKEREGKNHEQLLDLRLQMVRHLDPLKGAGVDLHNYLLENSPEWAEMQARKK